MGVQGLSRREFIGAAALAGASVVGTRVRADDDAPPRRAVGGRNLTCVVAICTDKGVIMGADSCGGDPSTYRTDEVKNPLKVAKVGEFLIGYTSSFRMGQILHNVLSPMQHFPGRDIYTEIVTKFIPQVIQTFKSEGFVKKARSGEDWGGEFLLAHGKRLFHVYADFCVIEFTDRFTACGCGAELATGAMHALDVANQRKLAKVGPKEMLEIALHTAEKYSGFVRGPFHFVQNF